MVLVVEVTSRGACWAKPALAAKATNTNSNAFTTESVASMLDHPHTGHGPFGLVAQIVVVVD